MPQQDEGFQLDERLAADTVTLGDYALSRVLLMKDANYPWLILVPRRDGVREIFELDEADQQQVLEESSRLSKTLMQLFNGDKMNVAALGNMVPQLHLHHIVRFEGDPAWPKPVWGLLPAKAYSEDDLKRRVDQLRDALSLN